jgi:hypothetical protein
MLSKNWIGNPKNSWIQSAKDYDDKKHNGKRSINNRPFSVNKILHIFNTTFNKNLNISNIMKVI